MPRNPYGSPPRIPVRRIDGIIWRGERWFIRDAIEATGVGQRTFEWRREQGWNIQQALETPVQGRTRIRRGLPPTRRELERSIRELTARVEALEARLSERAT